MVLTQYTIMLLEVQFPIWMKYLAMVLQDQAMRQMESSAIVSLSREFECVAVKIEMSKPILLHFRKKGKNTLVLSENSHIQKIYLCHNAGTVSLRQFRQAPQSVSGFPDFC